MGILFHPRSTIMANLSHFSSSSQSLFSTIITLYTLILIYFPHLFFKFVISPLFVSTLILLLTILRLGTSQQIQQQQQHLGINLDKDKDDKPSMDPGSQAEPKPDPELKLHRVECDQTKEVAKRHCNINETHSTLEPGPTPEPENCDPCKSVGFGSDVKDDDQEKEADPYLSWPTGLCLGWTEPKPGYCPRVLLEWDVGAPLEVIYEAYEGEEDGEEAQNDAFSGNEKCKQTGVITERYPSLSRYYPESDSDSDLDSYSESSSSLSLDEDEEEREGLIEIALDYGYGDKRFINNMIIMKPKLVDHDYKDVQFDEEDYLIEIDISPTKNMSDFSW